MFLRSLLAAALLAAPAAHATSFTFDAYDSDGNEGIAGIYISDSAIALADNYLDWIAQTGQSYAEGGPPAFITPNSAVSADDFYIYASAWNGDFGYGIETVPYYDQGEAEFWVDQVDNTTAALRVASPDVTEPYPIYEQEFTTYGGFSIYFNQPPESPVRNFAELADALQDGAWGNLYFSGTADDQYIYREISFGTEPVAAPPVPLPAGGLLMLGGIGSLATLRRRRGSPRA